MGFISLYFSLIIGIKYHHILILLIEKTPVKLDGNALIVISIIISFLLISNLGMQLGAIGLVSKLLFISIVSANISLYLCCKILGENFIKYLFLLQEKINFQSLRSS